MHLLSSCANCRVSKILHHYWHMQLFRVKPASSADISKKEQLICLMRLPFSAAGIWTVVNTFIQSLATLQHQAKKAQALCVYFWHTEQWQKPHKLSWEFLSKINEGNRKAFSFKLSLKSCTSMLALTLCAVAYFFIIIFIFFPGRFTQTGALIMPCIEINQDKPLSNSSGSHLRNTQTHSHS